MTAPGGLTPAYTVQVTPANDEPGDRTFTIVGDAAIGYHWQRKADGQDAFVDLVESVSYVGVAANELRVVAPTTAMNGDVFRCIVTTAKGVVISETATLSIGAPTLTIVGGNGQTGTAGAFNPKPFDLAVWNAAGTAPLVDTDVTFTIDYGGGQLATTNTPEATLVNSLTVKTDEDGTVQAYYKQPALQGVPSQIHATVGSTDITFQTTTLGAATDSSSSSSQLQGQNTSLTGRKLVVTSGSNGGKGLGSGSAKDKLGSMTHAIIAFPTSSLYLKTPADQQYLKINPSDWSVTNTTIPN